MIQWTWCVGDTGSSIRMWKCEGLKRKSLNTFHKERVSQVGNPDLFSWDHWFLMRNYTCHTWIFTRPWHLIWASLVAQLVEPTCNAGTQGDLGSIPGLGRSPEECGLTHSGSLAWRIPRTIQSMRSQRVGHDWATLTFHFHWHLI